MNDYRPRIILKRPKLQNSATKTKPLSTELKGANEVGQIHALSPSEVTIFLNPQLEQSTS